MKSGIPYQQINNLPAKRSQAGLPNQQISKLANQHISILANQHISILANQQISISTNQHINKPMALFSFFKTPKHQKFRYTPRYWDPQKEDLENRIKQAKKDNNDPEALKSRISKGLQRKHQFGGHRSASSSKKSTLRLLVIIGILLLFAYYFLVVYLPRFEEFLR